MNSEEGTLPNVNPTPEETATPDDNLRNELLTLSEKGEIRQTIKVASKKQNKMY